MKVTSPTLEELNQFRRLYLARLMEMEKGELALLDQDVMKGIRENSILSENIEEEPDKKVTLGERMADRIAEFDTIPY